MANHDSKELLQELYEVALAMSPGKHPLEKRELFAFDGGYFIKWSSSRHREEDGLPPFEREWSLYLIDDIVIEQIRERNKPSCKWAYLDAQQDGNLPWSETMEVYSLDYLD